MILIKKLFLSFTICAALIVGAQAQDTYKYAVDLTNVQNDKLMVSLETPEVSEKSVRFYMPKIIPGTYRESNFGRFVTDVTAYDKKGKELPVSKIDKNTWEVSKANKMTKLTYWVEDIFDSEIENEIYRMSATNIEEGKNFVINTPGFFGYFDGLKEVPFEVTFTKPTSFYGSTGLKPVSTTSSSEKYMTQDYDELVDSPLMFNEPDTTIINVANAEVLVSVYAPKGQVQSSFVASKLEDLLKAEAEYLGGKLPTDKYAFIMYFADPASASPLAGALEHNVSSFYYLPEYPQTALASTLVDIASHEFFHIVTPLTIHSEEIEDFDFNNPDLSKHLWLYEGVTEYASDHVQVKYGLNAPEEYLNKLAQKINNSFTQYDRSLPFTELSEKAISQYGSQYPNVYEKGALIAAMLDIRLLELSEGKMSLMDLLNKLADKYGKNKAFNDEELFGVIEEMTYPEIGDFFQTYVAGPNPLPLEDYFKKAGVIMAKGEEKEVATLGKISVGFNQEEARLMVNDINNLNEFGKQLGWKKGDLIYKINGEEVTPQTAQQIATSFTQNTKEGDPVTIVVGRKNEDGMYEEVTLKAPAQTTTSPGQVTLSFDEDAPLEALKLRNQWLTNNTVMADPKDVSSVDALVMSLYDVISGPAGERNWERFHSLYSDDATMKVVGKDQQGNPFSVVMTPEDYQEQNTPQFMQSGFFEKEIGRQSFIYGPMASVVSAYAFSFEEGGEAVQRGVNSIELVKKQGRWWVVSITWTPETPDNPIPEDLLD